MSIDIHNTITIMLCVRGNKLPIVIYYVFSNIYFRFMYTCPYCGASSCFLIASLRWVVVDPTRYLLRLRLLWIHRIAMLLCYSAACPSLWIGFILIISPRNCVGGGWITRALAHRTDLLGSPQVHTPTTSVALYIYLFRGCFNDRNDDVHAAARLDSTTHLTCEWKRERE